MWLAHRKIGYRLASGFGVVVILALILGLFALVRIHILAELTVKMYEHPLTVSNAVRDIRAEILAMHRTMKDVALAEDAEQVNAAMKVVDTHEQEVFKSFDIISERFLGGPEKVQKAQKAFADWKIIREQVSELMRQGKQREAEAITQGKGHEHVDYMIRTIDVMSDFASAKADELFIDSQQARKQEIFWTMGLFAAVLIASTFISVFICRSIANPISHISAEVKRFAEGEFGRRISIESRDEIGMLASEFNHMASELERTTTSISNLNNEIGRRKQVEDELRESEEQFRGLVESSCDWIWEVNAECVYTYASLQVEEILGYKPEEILGKSLFDLMLPEEAQRITEVVQHLKEAGKPIVTIENVNLHKDGRRVVLETSGVPVFDKTGKVIGYRGMDRDITERKEAEEMATSLGRIIEESLNEIYIFDAQTLRFILVNEGARKNLGYTMGELEELTPLDLKPEFTVESFLKLVEPLRNREKDQVRFRTVHKRKNGELYPVEVDIQISTFKSSSIFVAIILDVTRQKKMEDEREGLLGELASKNEELESILYVSSHDLKSPLINIQGFSGELGMHCEKMCDLLREKTPDEESAKVIVSMLDEFIPETLEYIQGGVDKMGVLLDGLLKVTRIGRIEVNINVVDMNEMIEEIRRSMEFRIKKNGVSFHAASLPNCLGDKVQISQVFSNLIDNALKYLDPERKGRINISGRVENGRSIYCVEDNGIGIFEKYHKQIFELFHRLNPDEGLEGEGIGLTIVKRILDRHNGSIRLESNEGQGSKFFVSLPTV